MSDPTAPAGAGDDTAHDAARDSVTRDGMARTVAYMRAHASRLAELVPALRRAEAAGDTAAADDVRAQLDQLAQQGQALADELDAQLDRLPDPPPRTEAGPR